MIERRNILVVLGSILLIGAVWGVAERASEAAVPVSSSGAHVASGAAAMTPMLGAATLAGRVEADADEDRVWTVAVISDLNDSYGSTTHNQHVHAATAWITETLKPDLVVSAGDMVAGQRRGLNYLAMWRGFHAAVTDPMIEAGIPLAVTPGNHDASGSPAFWEERIHFAREWTRRRPQLQFVDDRFYPFFYAFEIGPALFISLDATQVGPLDPPQREWVRRTLEQNAHRELKFFLGHLPLFPVARGRAHETLGDRELEALFVEHDVTMMIAGHHHAYYPGRRGDVLHLHAACLGSGPRVLLEGEQVPSPRNVAVIRFDGSGLIDVEAYLSPRFEEKVALESLPPWIGDGEERIWRMDVAQEE